MLPYAKAWKEIEQKIASDDAEFDIEAERELFRQGFAAGGMRVVRKSRD